MSTQWEQSTHSCMVVNTPLLTSQISHLQMCVFAQRVNFIFIVSRIMKKLTSPVNSKTIQVHNLKPELNVQTDSIGAEVFV